MITFEFANGTKVSFCKELPIDDRAFVFCPSSYCYDFERERLEYYGKVSLYYDSDIDIWVKMPSNLLDFDELFTDGFTSCNKITVQ
jgi:hypothetical protein